MGEELTFKDGEDAAQNEINEKGFHLELWNEFLEHPADFEALFSDVLIGKPKNFKIGTFITAPPIPIGADIKPLITPQIAFANRPILISRFSSFSLRKSK